MGAAAKKRAWHAARQAAYAAIEKELAAEPSILVDPEVRRAVRMRIAAHRLEHTGS